MQEFTLKNISKSNKRIRIVKTNKANLLSTNATNQAVFIDDNSIGLCLAPITVNRMESKGINPLTPIILDIVDVYDRAADATDPNYSYAELAKTAGVWFSMVDGEIISNETMNLADILKEIEIRTGLLVDNLHKLNTTGGKFATLYPSSNTTHDVYIRYIGERVTTNVVSDFYLNVDVEHIKDEDKMGITFKSPRCPTGVFRINNPTYSITNGVPSGTPYIITVNNVAYSLKITPEQMAGDYQTSEYGVIASVVADNPELAAMVMAGEMNNATFIENLTTDVIGLTVSADTELPGDNWNRTLWSPENPTGLYMHIPDAMVGAYDTNSRVNTSELSAPTVINEYGIYIELGPRGIE